MLIISVILAVSNNVTAQAPETEIREWKDSLEKQPQIVVGNSPSDIQINEDVNKIYVANGRSNSIRNGNSSTLKNIGVGSRLSTGHANENRTIEQQTRLYTRITGVYNYTVV
jgi:hypothetical protein